MTMHNALHQKSNVDCLYIPKKEGGRRSQGVKETVNLTNLGSEIYAKESRERLPTPVRSVDIGLSQYEKLQ